MLKCLPTPPPPAFEVLVHFLPRGALGVAAVLKSRNQKCLGQLPKVWFTSSLSARRAEAAGGSEAPPHPEPSGPSGCTLPPGCGIHASLPPCALGMEARHAGHSSAGTLPSSSSLGWPFIRTPQGPMGHPAKPLSADSHVTGSWAEP